MVNDQMDSEYVRRPDAQRHLKVMELLRKWDPIGVLDDTEWPDDEYDIYSAPMARMLDAGISEKNLYNHMKSIVKERMELACDKKKTKQIAHELVEFWKEWKPNQ
jgi:hypothetical protein